MKRIRIRGAGLLAEYLADTLQHPALPIRESVSAYHQLPFRVYLLHSRPIIIRANEVALLPGFRSTVNPNKTDALERVLQATAQYSICGCGGDAAPTTTSWSIAHSLAKASEGKFGGAVVRMSREVVYL